MRQNFRVNGVGKNERMSLVQVRVKHQQLPESLDGNPFFFLFSSDEGRIRLKMSLVPCMQMNERLRVGRSCITAVFKNNEICLFFFDCRKCFLFGIYPLERVV
jgi:hypothetical protein